MKPLVALVLIALLTPSAGVLAAEKGPMTQQRMEAFLRELAPGAEGVPGSLGFRVEGVAIECISDVAHDRMRLIAAIAPVSKLTAEQVARVLEANFHSALDARYATSGGYLYAAFIHPLSPLTERELRSAALQVANLARSFGTTYSSGELVYGGGAPL
jgi:hypothetical protein